MNHSQVRPSRKILLHRHRSKAKGGSIREEKFKTTEEEPLRIGCRSLSIF